jgi:hypothetical protein
MGSPGTGDRFVRPRALFLGAACAFAACCLAGRLGVRHNLFDSFERFHIYVNPSTCFYPTASQVRALGRARLDPDKVAVVIGGDSIMYGVGQPLPEVWTRHLQDRLGDGYCVLNLGLWASTPHEFGAVAAEVLSADRPRLILVADAPASAYPCVPDGVMHPYFFWDAYYKGLLRTYPERMAAIARVPPGRPGCTPADQAPARALLNSACYFDDLWNAVAYRRGGTVWNWRMPDTWYRPRRTLPDPEVPPPTPDSRHPPEVLDYNMTVVRGRFLYGGCKKDGSGRWVEDPAAPAWAALQDGARSCFPEPDRKRTLLVIVPESPYYVGRLSPDEQGHYRALGRLTAEKLEAAGFAALDAGDIFSAEDYADSRHLAASGGAKLAALVAGRVRRMAAELGYDRSKPGGGGGGRLATP